MSLSRAAAEEKWRLREAEEYAKEKAARRERRAAAESGAPPVRSCFLRAPRCRSLVCFLSPNSVREETLAAAMTDQ